MHKDLEEYKGLMPIALLNEIEELGDDDILDQSAGFLGLYYYMQGLFKNALIQLERAERVSESQIKDQLVNPLVPVLMGYCFIYLYL